MALAVAAATAIAASVAVAGPIGSPVASSDGNSQAYGALITPKKLGKKTFTPAALEVTTHLTTSAASGVPVPTTHVQIDFDKGTQIFTKGVPTCNASKLQSTSTEVAIQACKSAVIGSGKAHALLAVGGKIYDVDQTVTAFNGVPQGGKPVILLHTYGTTPVQTTLVLTGKVTNLNKEGFGPRLDVEVPLIAGGTGVLTDFQVKVKKDYKYKGKPVSYISAKCPSSHKLKTRSVFTFLDGQSSDPVFTQSCTQNPKK
ncbi:MAG TPA: hypothetical protein VF731_06125 [Solirubrobacterales bacterium]